MRVRARFVLAVPAILMAAALFSGCQNATSATETLDVDDFVDGAATPTPATPVASTGKTYRVVRGNNQPDDILEYAWKTTFTVVVTFNANSTKDSVDLTFPVSLTAATVKIEQASGGVVIPSTSGETEHYESAILQTSANKITAAGNSIAITFDVWYTLPNGGKDALATVTLSFKDSSSSPKTFTKTVTNQIGS